jgi:hypothetical protein
LLAASVPIDDARIQLPKHCAVYGAVDAPVDRRLVLP